MKVVIWLEGVVFLLCPAVALAYALRTSRIMRASGILYFLFAVWFIIFYLLIPGFRVWQTGDEKIWDSFCDPGPAMAFLFIAGIYSAIFGLICGGIRAMYRLYKNKNA